MGTKASPGKFDCYEKAEDDEPMFVLLARDPIAPMLVETWAQHQYIVEHLGEPLQDLPVLDDDPSDAEREALAKAIADRQVEIDRRERVQEKVQEAITNAKAMQNYYAERNKA